MAEFPARGQKAPDFWDQQLKHYIDAGVMTRGSLNLTAANPVVPSLSGWNEWTIAEPLTLTLPGPGDVESALVHVASGFQDLTWPIGTVTYGSTSDDEAWLTILRDTVNGNWVVLIPGSEGGSGGDTGWVDIVAGSVTMGTASYDVGSAVSFVTTDWGPPAAPPEGPFIDDFYVRVRRIGNTVFCGLSNIQAKVANPDGVMVTLPSWAYRDVEAGEVVYVAEPTEGQPSGVGFLKMSFSALGGNVCHNIPQWGVLGASIGGSVGQCQFSWPVQAGNPFPEAV